MLSLHLPAVAKQTKSATPTAPVVKTLEAVGVPFEAILMHDRMVARVKREVKGPSEAQKRARAAAASPVTEKRISVKLTDEDTSVNWYEILCIEEDADLEAVEVAYKKRILETHPDKQADHSDILFKQVQRGYALLSDPDARRSLDSSRPFDDSVPKDSVTYTADNFYDTFAPVFERNGKWSLNTAVPELGDDNMSAKDAKKFYDFWMNFRSWRDFAHQCDLHAIEETYGRDEKRYYQRENQRAVQSKKADESKRIRALVEHALKNDPRIQREREQEEAARIALKDAREAEKLKSTEDARRRKDEVAAKEKAEKEAAEQAAEDAKNAHKTAIKNVGDFLKDHQLVEAIQTNGLFTGTVRRPNLSYLLQNADAEEAVKCSEAVCNASPLQLADGTVPAVLAFNASIGEIEVRVGRNRFGEAVKADREANVVTASDAVPAAVDGAKWNRDDEAALEKVVARYADGAKDRWVFVGAAMRYKFTQKDLEAKVTALTPVWKAKADGVAAPAAAAAAGGSAEEGGAWTPKQVKQLETALRTFKDAKEKGKFSRIAEHVDGKTAKQCVTKSKALAASKGKK
jgi:DnaJ family protein C protein 2